MKIFISLLLLISFLQSSVVVSGDDYSVIEDDKIEIIYSDEYKVETKKANTIERKVLQNYEKSYGYALDSKLYLGLLSSNNQIANAFSTQIPLNMQMNYLAGNSVIDYMASPSWLKMLLLHESAHNFQLNPKKNPLSKISHNILGNLPFTMLFFVPIFPIPNALEASFMLEGNAVFNESRFNNGGRLYNGSLLALTILQARSKNITAKKTYNNHLYFPYNRHNYVIGGFFQLYLAQEHGLDSVNKYFWNFSSQYLPIQTSWVFEKSFGGDYKSELSGFVTWLNDKYKDFKVTNENILTSSKSYAKLNSDSDEIYFLTSNHLSKPKLNVISKKDEKISSKKERFRFGEVFKVGGEYLSSSSSKTDVQKIEMGLFDKNGKLCEKSKSKIMQGVLSDGRFVYFDVKSSFDSAKLYVGDSFYDVSNSSVFIDSDDNLYYFKQKGKTKTLYKNKTPLFTLQDWYGFVVDVDKNGIYFIANSKNGSSLYRYAQGSFFKVVQGDDIVDAKLLSDDRAVLTVIRADGYDYVVSALKPANATPYSRSYFFEKRDDFNFITDDKTLNKSKPYKSYTNLKYSSLVQSFEIDENSDISFSVATIFTDPLQQNSLRLYLSRYDDETIAGVGYKNSESIVTYGVDVYALLEKDDNISSRDFGLNLSAKYPFYVSGYKRGDLKLGYHLDHDRDDREPLSLSLNFRELNSYGDSMYLNYLNSLTLFAVEDRDDYTLGAKYSYFRELGNEFYMGASLKYAKSNTDKKDKKYGIDIDDARSSNIDDPSRFVMSSLSADIYAKEVLKGSLSLYKVFNFDYYSFTIPLSLRRESIYTKYSYFDVTFLSDKDKQISEYQVGLTLELLLMHNYPVPLTFEYSYNEDVKDDGRFKVLFDLSF